MALLLVVCGCVPKPRYLPKKAVLPYELREITLPDSESLIGTINYYIGTPYKYGGCTRKGIDCSCFVKTVFAEALGLNLPRTVAQQWKYGKPVSRDELAFGDIVFFRTSKRKVPSHSGIYIGGGRFAHASSSLGVSVAKLSDPYWSKRYAGARRVIKR